MSCPNWRLLSSRRDRDPEAWERALEHSDDCRRCRERALAEEPTLLFRRLPAPAVGRDEITAMKQAVAVLRRSEPAASRPRSRPRRAPLLRAAALAALVIGAAALQGAGGGVDVAGVGSPGPAATVASLDELAPRPRPGRLAVEDLPLIEAVHPSYGSVVQVVDDEISLILVLPPNDV